MATKRELEMELERAEATIELLQAKVCGDKHKWVYVSESKRFNGPFSLIPERCRKEVCCRCGKVRFV